MILKYKIKCFTCNKVMFWYLDKNAEPPTTCPCNSSHNVCLNSVAAIDIANATQEVITQDEKLELWTAVISGESNVDDNGNAVIELTVPVGGRYLQNARAWFSDSDDGDRITKIELVVGDRVVGIYHDDKVPEAMRGMRIPKHLGYVDICKINGKGYVPEGVKIRIVGVRIIAMGKMFLNLTWGRDSAT